MKFTYIANSQTVAVNVRGVSCILKYTNLDQFESKVRECPYFAGVLYLEKYGKNTQKNEALGAR